MKFKLIGKKQEALGTKSFFFEPKGKFEFLAGQYVYLTLPKLNFPDPRGATRHFTISSSPTEKAIRITTRIRQESGYKKTLDQLKLGSVLEAGRPDGVFALDTNLPKNNSVKYIFLAGGIGITPFRSTIKYKIDKNLPIFIHLIYSDSTPEQITFKDELENWAKKGFIKLDMTVTKPKESKVRWGGLTGRINTEMLNKLVPNANLSASSFWLCGPPAFVNEMENQLDKLEVDQEKIISEKFTGY